MKKDEKGNPLTFWGGLAEIKQETIEEAAEKYSSYDEHKMDFIVGAKWQQERMYSEGDMHTAWNSSEQNMRFQFSSSVYKNITFDKWIKQFKK